MLSRKQLSKLTSVVSMSALVVSLTACGGASDRAVRVAGEVTYKGQPVPYGTIVFDPEQPGGGPQGTATIRNGKFDTNERGMGLAGGAYTARITGFSGEPDVTSETSSSKPLFPEHKQKLEVTKSITNQKIAIE